MTSENELRDAIDSELGLAVDLRRRLHADPRVSGDESATREAVLEALPTADGYHETAETGAIVRIGGLGPAVAVRAELDALGVQEETDVAWRSQRIGVMHACGHDVHMAAVVALARAIARVGAAPLPLLVILQPREESYPSGARDVVLSGLLSEQNCLSVIGAHVQPLLEVGDVACAPGVVNASSDEFAITVRGTGGHAAYPHLTNDPVHALAQVIVALQSHVSRSVDPMSSVVVSVTVLEAGGAANVIPAVAIARGTVRAMNGQDRQAARVQIRHIARMVAQTHGCTGEVDITDGEPPLSNDPHLAAVAARNIKDSGLRPVETMRSAGSDDFSYYSEALPSLMMFVGAHEEQQRLHASNFLPADDRVRDVAIALLAGYCAAAEMHLHGGAASPLDRLSPPSVATAIVPATGSISPAGSLGAAHVTSEAALD